MFLKNKNIIFKIRRSKVKDYADLILFILRMHAICRSDLLSTIINTKNRVKSTIFFIDILNIVINILVVFLLKQYDDNST